LFLMLCRGVQFDSVLEGVLDDVCKWFQVGEFFEQAFYVLWFVSSDKCVLGDVLVCEVSMQAMSGGGLFQGGFLDLRKGCRFSSLSIHSCEVYCAPRSLEDDPCVVVDEFFDR